MSKTNVEIAKMVEGRTYYDDIDKCYKHSGCKVSKEIAE